MSKLNIFPKTQKTITLWTLCGENICNLHFYDWHILRGRVHDKLSLHGFDSEKDGLVSWLQHLSQELYQKQHYN